MPEIRSSMTIPEALSHLPEPDRSNLKRWSETFWIKLGEIHIGHIKTYQQDRRRETDAATVDLEVATLLKLLRGLSLTDEIDRHYRPLSLPN